MRRIGFETLTAFKIQLNCKLNEIMPLYNKMFDSLNNWDIFSGEITTRIGEDRTENSQLNNVTTQNNATTNASNNSVQDRRFSDTPQDKIEDVKDGSYVTNYSYDTENNVASDNSIANSETQSSISGNDKKNYNEVTTKTPTSLEKIEILKQMQIEINNIYSLIYKNLDDLFYGLV